MAKLVLTMTMSLDGFFAGPGGELDWMTQAPDPEFSRDNVSFFDRFDRGFIGYPTASGMLPYWLAVAGDPRPRPTSGLSPKQSTGCIRSSSPTGRSTSRGRTPNCSSSTATSNWPTPCAARRQSRERTSASPAESAPPRPSSGSG